MQTSSIIMVSVKIIQVSLREERKCLQQSFKILICKPFQINPWVETEPSHLYSDGSKRAPCFECTMVASWAHIRDWSSSLPLYITNVCHPLCCSIQTHLVSLVWMVELSIDTASVLVQNTAQLMDTSLGAGQKQHLPQLDGLQVLCQPKRFSDFTWVSMQQPTGRWASWESLVR